MTCLHSVHFFNLATCTANRMQAVRSRENANKNDTCTASHKTYGLMNFSPRGERERVDEVSSSWSLYRGHWCSGRIVDPLPHKTRMLGLSSASNTPDQDARFFELPKRLRRCSKCLVHAETRSLRERLLSSISICFVILVLVFRTNICFRTDPPARNVSSAKYRSAVCNGILRVTKGYVEGGCHSTVSPRCE